MWSPDDVEHDSPLPEIVYTILSLLIALALCGAVILLIWLFNNYFVTMMNIVVVLFVIGAISFFTWSIKGIVFGRW